MENCSTVETLPSPASYRDFYTTPDTGEGGASAAEGTELPLLSHAFALLAYLLLSFWDRH